MRDLKYPQAAGTFEQFQREVKAIFDTRSPALRPIGKAFTDNLKRISFVAMMPIEIAHRAKRDQQIEDYAALKSALEPMPFLHSKAQDIGRLSEVAVNWIEQLIRDSKGMRESMEAVLASLIINSWIAFESLATDLWIAGVDNGPAAVAARLHIAGDKMFERTDDSIRPETIHELKIDPRTHYGSFLRAIGKVSFQKLHKIRACYEAAFGRDAGKLFDQTEGGYIYALSAVRNVLIHTSGRADKQFQKQVARFPELREIAIDQKVLVDGALVNKLRSAAAVLGAALLHCVDDIITPPQPDVANTANLETD
jgi:hypothetical protein